MRSVPELSLVRSRERVWQTRSVRDRSTAELFEWGGGVGRRGLSETQQVGTYRAHKCCMRGKRLEFGDRLELEAREDGGGLWWWWWRREEI